MNGQQLGLALSVFLACTVEAVEALTIVLAMGLTRGWRSTLAGVGGALLFLAALVAALGPALLALPLNTLRLFVGALLLVFGLQWLSKAILRAAGLKALHDERAIFARETQAARSATSSARALDPYAFTLTFKGVLLEGLEVVFIVLTFGANQHRIGLATASAGAAVALVIAIGILARAPLASVPENAMKFGVGIMLTSFGTFWATEGTGAAWPGEDAALPALIPATLLAALGVAWALRSRPVTPPVSHPAPATDGRAITRAMLGIWDFLVGEDWRAPLGVLVALCLTALVASSGVAAWWLPPLAVMCLLTRPLLRRRG